MYTEEYGQTPLSEGKGKLLKIKGFSPNQRAAFMKLIMAYGLEDSFWKLLHEKNVGFLRAKSSEHLQEYCKILLLHLLEEETNDAHYFGTLFCINQHWAHKIQMVAQRTVDYT